MTEYRRERVERDCDMLIVRERLVSCQQLAPNKTYRHTNIQTCYNRVSLCQIARPGRSYRTLLKHTL